MSVKSNKKNFLKNIQ